MLPIAIAFFILGTTNVPIEILKNIEAIQRYWPEPSKQMEIVRIFNCESGLRQYDKNGKVITSHTFDKGISQINVPLHGKRAKELGHKLDTLEGSLGYARTLYDEEGVNPWVCSRLVGG